MDQQTMFEEPINISEYINSSPDKDVWLLKLVSKLSNDLNKIFKSSTDFDMVIEKMSLRKYSSAS
ncbi:21905_t:CDS:2 [Entrophospora sp. SA101]|nr:21905_t:CDS:2 [Entrophospora sp. SA101]